MIGLSGDLLKLRSRRNKGCVVIEGGERGRLGDGEKRQEVKDGGIEECLAVVDYRRWGREEMGAVVIEGSRNRRIKLGFRN